MHHVVVPPGFTVGYGRYGIAGEIDAVYDVVEQQADAVLFFRHAEFGFYAEFLQPHEPCWLQKGVLGLSPSHVSNV